MINYTVMHNFKLPRPRLLSDIQEREDVVATSSSSHPGNHASPTTNCPSRQSRTANIIAYPQVLSRSFTATINNPIHSFPNRLRPLTPIHNIMSPPPNECDTSSSSRKMPRALLTSPTPSESGSPALRPSSASSFHRQASPPNSRCSRGLPREQSRCASAPLQLNTSSPCPRTPHHYSKPSVKHLTCYWWKEKGECKFNAEDCLYSHRDTGKYADAPKQITPGEPARAGRNLKRELVKQHMRSSSSLANFDQLNIHGVSRPNTPRTDDFATCADMFTDAEIIKIEHDIAFFRNLVEQNGKEKAVFVSTIEKLQDENQNLKSEIEHLKSEKSNLITERDALRGVVIHLQHQQISRLNPFGAVGKSSGSGV